MNEWDIAINNIKEHARGIIFGIILGLIGATCIIIFQTPTYQTAMIIGPTERTGVPSLNSLLPKGAADAPALQYFVERIDASRATDFTVFETKITSPNILTRLSQNSNFNIPSDTQKWAKSNLKIQSHGMTPFRKITLKHKDKGIGKDILNTLHQETDKSIRLDKKIKTVRRISYLNQQLDTVKNPSHRDAIIRLLKEQEQIAMMVSIDNEFAAEIITPAYTNANAIAPNWKIIFPAFIFIGGFIGFIISGLRQAIKS